MQSLFEIVLPVFIVVGLGYAVTWRGVFNEHAISGIVTFTQNFAIPCLVFRAISRIELSAITNVSLIASYYIGAFSCFILGYLGARRFFDRSPTDAVAIGFSCFFSNTILLGLPITERAFGPDALDGNFAIIAFHAPLLYLTGVAAMEITRSSSANVARRVSSVGRSLLHNPLVIAIGLGLLVNVTSLPLPGPLAKSIDLLADAALPAALFGLGGVLYQYRPEGDVKTIMMICSISLIGHPAIVFGVGTALALDQASMRSAVLTAAMAPGVNVCFFANMYNAACRVAAASVLIGTAACVLSVWLWLMVLA